ncbi:MAG: hypothetical protein AVDCRST_MAG85-864, partial [uncultured Solirubrobacteraceae bacterium]
ERPRPHRRVPRGDRHRRRLRGERRRHGVPAWASRRPRTTAGRYGDARVARRPAARGRPPRARAGGEAPDDDRRGRGPGRRHGTGRAGGHAVVLRGCHADRPRAAAGLPRRRVRRQGRGPAAHVRLRRLPRPAGARPARPGRRELPAHAPLARAV